MSRRRADKRSTIRHPAQGGGWRYAYPPYAERQNGTNTVSSSTYKNTTL